jgi:hypothetical protein
VPVVGDEHAVLAGAEGQHARGLNGRLAEQREALVVVHVVRAGAGAVQLGAGLAPDLGQEQGVVDPYAVHALLDAVEVADLLAHDVNDHRGIPSVSVLVVAARGKPSRAEAVSRGSLVHARAVDSAHAGVGTWAGILLRTEGRRC